MTVYLKMARVAKGGKDWKHRVETISINVKLQSSTKLPTSNDVLSEPLK